MRENPVGRPPNRALSGALRLAAERVMATEGFSALTIDALTTEVGTTRPTFYRRYPSLAHLALDVLVHRFGDNSYTPTQDLLGDLIELQRQEVNMFADPLMQKSIPGLLAELSSDPQLGEVFRENFVIPRRKNVLGAVDRAVARGELTHTPENLDLLCDYLLGPILVRAMIPTGKHLDDQLARTTAEYAYQHLRENFGPTNAGEELR